jgi:hypothetical protein
MSSPDTGSPADRVARLEFAVSRPPGKSAEEGEKETGRVEAFSDGVFAIERVAEW